MNSSPVTTTVIIHALAGIWTKVLAPTMNSVGSTDSTPTGCRAQTQLAAVQQTGAHRTPSKAQKGQSCQRTLLGQTASTLPGSWSSRPGQLGCSREPTAKIWFPAA